MKKVNLLWIGDAVAATGFASVTHNVLDSLSKDKYDITVLGINYYGDPHDYNYRIYPAIVGGDPFGINRLAPIVKDRSPDIIMMLNDPWNIDQYLEKIPDYKGKIVTYFPVDAEEHSFRWFSKYNKVSKMCVYNEFGKKVVLGTGAEYVTEEKIKVIPHGTDIRSFFPLEKEYAWKAIFPEQDISQYINSFVVFNGNRNQPRKRIDITMWAFKEFQKDKDDVKLYLHMGTTDAGIDIVVLALRYGFPHKLVITGNTPGIPSVSKERLNLIYNSADIGINTSEGEGWGLVSWEHASTKTPQIIPYNSSIPYIWEPGTAMFINAKTPKMHPAINTVGRTPSIEHTIELLNTAYNDWKFNSSKGLQKIADSAYNMVTAERYSWKTVANSFDEVFTEVLNDNNSVA